MEGSSRDGIDSPVPFPGQPAVNARDNSAARSARAFGRAATAMPLVEVGPAESDRGDEQRAQRGAPHYPTARRAGIRKSSRPPGRAMGSAPAKTPAASFERVEAASWSRSCPATRWREKMMRLYFQRRSWAPDWRP